MPAHIRKDDTVIIISGDHKGKTGEVMSVDRDNDRVFVKGVNMKSRHTKPTQLNPQGGIITKEGSLHMSNVCPVVDGKATRVRFESKDDGSKTRVAVRGGKVLGVVRGPKNRG